MMPWPRDLTPAQLEWLRIHVPHFATCAADVARARREEQLARDMIAERKDR